MVALAIGKENLVLRCASFVPGCASSSGAHQADGCFAAKLFWFFNHTATEKVSRSLLAREAHVAAPMRLPRPYISSVRCLILPPVSFSQWVCLIFISEVTSRHQYDVHQDRRGYSVVLDGSEWL